jgi:hypothetical protein
MGNTMTCCKEGGNDLSIKQVDYENNNTPDQ